MKITDEYFDKLTIDGTIFPTADDLFYYAKTTRRKLEIAREALEQIQKQGKTWGKNECGIWLTKLSSEALADINKEG